MKPGVSISVCIPSYKRVVLLKRLLDSVAVQTFRDFEVIVTDDSPDDSVKDLCRQFEGRFPIFYYRNERPLGTPENWNEAIRKASGRWIKLMHDDDWFAFAGSLQEFYAMTLFSQDCSFVFSGSTTIEDDKILKTQNISRFAERFLRKDPRNLFFRNFIGPPSVIMHKNDGRLWYDARMKWLVDVDFYIRYLEGSSFNFTRKVLVNVGFNEAQVTKQVFHDPLVVIPENLLLLEKLGPGILLRIWNYDFCWRLIRNYKISGESQLNDLHPGKGDSVIPRPLLHMLKAQGKIPRKLLQTGLFSKAFMLLNYITWRLEGKGKG